MPQPSAKTSKYTEYHLFITSSFNSFIYSILKKSTVPDVAWKSSQFLLKFYRERMKFLEVVLIFTVWLEIEEVFALFETCDNEVSATNAQLSNGFYLNSPNFPNTRYPSGSSCRFHIIVQRGYEITLSCQITMENCQTDQFYVAIDGGKTLQNSPSYCGQQNMQIQMNSLFNELTFGHISSADSQAAGYYSCFVKPKKQNACDCGWSVSAGARIVGGTDANPNEFISMVGIQKTGDPFNRVFAGGTLSNFLRSFSKPRPNWFLHTQVHFRYILTAAHAVLDVNPSSILALVGYHDLSSNPDTQYSRKYGIESIIIHEHYNPTNNMFNYDVALLRTNEDVQYNYGVGPACLPVDTNK